MVDADKVLAAAKAAYPELWPADEKPGDRHPNPAGLALARQEALSRMTQALEAAATTEGNDPESMGLVTIELPEDAAMVQQTLTTVAFIDNEGRTAYSVFTTGEGLLASWVGMAALTQNYLLHQGGMQQ